MALAARTLGVRHPHPWQLSAWDVAGELVEVDGVLRHAYSTVVWSLPRRAGKTIGVLARVLALLAAEDQRGWYTAQSRQDAATQLRDEWLPMIQASPYGPHIRSRMTNGSEVIMSPSRRSSCRLFAPKPEALHGAAGDLIVYDEAWSQTRERGAELIAAARPLMATRPGAQLWIVSAAGDEQSTWWADWLTIGRDAAAADTGHGVAFVEYGADAPDLDLDDPAVWDRMHPAVRSAANPHGTITREWLEVERATIGTAQFARLYGNVTDRTGATGASPIDVEGWLQLGVDTLDRDGLLTLGVDVSPDQASTAIVAATHERATTLEVVDHRAGTGWAVERIVDLCDRYHVHAVALDSGAPAGVLDLPLRAAGVPVLDAKLRDMAAASAQFVEAVATGSVFHVEHVSLDRAVVAARKRPTGDGSWLWGRRSSDVDITPLVAATLARWSHPAVFGSFAAIR